MCSGSIDSSPEAPGGQFGSPDPNRTDKRFTLYSVKGGVGRSTTVAVLARHLAAGGERLLAVDLDLESPGLSSALIEPEARPACGVTEWFVEDLVGQGDQVIWPSSGAFSWTSAIRGRYVLNVSCRDSKPSAPRRLFSWRAAVGCTTSRPLPLPTLTRRSCCSLRTPMRYRRAVTQTTPSLSTWMTTGPPIIRLPSTGVEASRRGRPCAPWSQRSFRRRTQAFCVGSTTSSAGMAKSAVTAPIDSMVELSWPRHELYGLLWHWLANGPDGQVFRRFLQPGDWPSGSLDGRTVVSVPRKAGPRRGDPARQVPRDRRPLDGNGPQARLPVRLDPEPPRGTAKGG